MACAHYFAPVDGAFDACFSVDAASITFGRGALEEAGERTRALGCRRVALFTDRAVAALPLFARLQQSLSLAGVDAAAYCEVQVEPSSASFLAAARFFREGSFDGALSLGGGSVMDTAKAALLYGTHPAPFLRYLNKPLGEGLPPPGPLPPHIACPTTAGTGSECTGIAVCDLADPPVKSAIAHRLLRPTLALIDPSATETLPSSIVAASGFDVLCHALESYTARPYYLRARPPTALLRPMSQGANPFSDVGSLEALRLCGRYLQRAVRDATDREARDGMMYAATLAAIAFGNAGVHVPHAMAYAAGGHHAATRDFQLPGYPGGLVPHGLSVVLCAPAALAHVAPACPERVWICAEALGLGARGVEPKDAGTYLAGELVRAIAAAGLPPGLAHVGYGPVDVPALAEGADAQQRLLQNAPREVSKQDLAALFHDSLRSPS